MQSVPGQLIQNHSKDSLSSSLESTPGPSQTIRTTKAKAAIKITDLLAGNDSFTNKLKAALLAEM